FQPYIERILDGDEKVLTSHKVEFLEPTSGSTGPAKYIPFTPQVQDELSEALLTWTADVLRNQPEQALGKHYWALSPPDRPHSAPRSRVRVGATSDGDYFNPATRLIFGESAAVTSDMVAADDIPTWRYLTLLHLIRCDDLSLISIWSPLFLTLLCESLDNDFEQILRDVERGGRGYAPLPDRA